MINKNYIKNKLIKSKNIIKIYLLKVFKFLKKYKKKLHSAKFKKLI